MHFSIVFETHEARILALTLDSLTAWSGELSLDNVEQTVYDEFRNKLEMIAYPSEKTVADGDFPNVSGEIE